MALNVYAYAGCSTCKKALKFLDRQDIKYTAVPIREKPPTVAELRRMLNYVNGDIRKLFNTSGRDYKELDMKSKLPTMAESDALALLASHGNLVKRPFVLGDGFGMVGFNEADWETRFRS